MKRYACLLLLVCLMLCRGNAWAKAEPHTVAFPPLSLHYDRPAEFFEEALVIGNGRLGATVYGGTREDRLEKHRSSDTGVSLKLSVSADHPGKLIGRIENHSEEAWSYIKNYDFPMLSVKLEDKWYQLPRYPWGAGLIDDFVEITSLAPGEYLYRIYGIEWAYRKLLPGHYMLWENDGPAVEFDVKDEDGKNVIVP